MKKLLHILVMFPLIAATIPAHATRAVHDIPDAAEVRVVGGAHQRIRNQQNQQAQRIAEGIERLENEQLDAITKAGVYTIILIVLIYVVASYYVG